MFIISDRIRGANSFEIEHNSKLYSFVRETKELNCFMDKNGKVSILNIPTIVKHYTAEHPDESKKLKKQIKKHLICFFYQFEEKDRIIMFN